MTQYRTLRRAARGALPGLTARVVIARCAAALMALGALGAPQADAAEFTANDDAGFRQAIQAANADPGPTSTIRLTGSVQIDSRTPLPTITRPLTIDTQAFTLSGQDGASGADGSDVVLTVSPGVTLTVTGEAAGIITGGDGGDATGAGGAGGTGTRLSGGDLVNRAIIRGGDGGNGFVGGAGGRGVELDSGKLTNRGMIVGGNGGNGSDSGAGGIGIHGDNLTVINDGTISAGFAAGGTGPRGDAIRFGSGTNRLELWAGSVINGDVLATIDSDDTLTLGGDMDPASAFDVSRIGADKQYQGFERFEKTGASTWTLTGSGAQDWTIEAGTLKAGADGALGDGAAYTVNGGTLDLNGFDLTMGALSGGGGQVVLGGADLIVDQATDTTYAGDIVGDGDLIKAGAGALTLTGTTMQDWTIEAGTLKAGADGALGDGAAYTVNGGMLDLNGFDLTMGALSGGGGQVVLGGADLIVDQATDTTYAGDIVGDGDLTKAGAGALTLTGDSPYIGMIAVEAGTLTVNGALAGAATTVTGGTLAGTGTVGTTTIGAGARLAPGNSIGTLTVDGDITFAPKAVYEVEANAQGSSDLIDVTGAATLQGGSVLVLASDGDYAPRTEYTILTADDGVNGEFGPVSSRLAFLDPMLGYGANAVTLTLVRNDIDFEEVARTRNQRAAATGIDSLAPGDAVYDAVVGLIAAGARAAYDQLSGEIYASTTAALIEDSRFIRAATNRRLRAALEPSGGETARALKVASTVSVLGAGPGGSAMWAHAFGAWATSETDGNAAELERSTRGLLLGADALIVHEWRFGVLAGYSHTSIDIDKRLSSADSDNYHIGIYGGRLWGALRLRIGAAHTWHELDVERTPAFTGFAERLEADTGARTAQAYGELGYRVEVAAVALEPFAGLAYVHLYRDDFTEQGGDAALTADSDSTDVSFSTLGLRAALGLEVVGMPLTVRGMLGWRHAFDDAPRTTTLAFDGGTSFTVAGVPMAEDAAVIAAGLDLDIAANTIIGIAYSGRLSDRAREHSVKGNLTVRF